MQFSSDRQEAEGALSNAVGVQSPKASVDTFEVGSISIETEVQLNLGLRGLSFELQKSFESLVSFLFNKIEKEQFRIFELNSTRKNKVLTELQYLTYKVLKKDFDWRLEQEEIFENEEKRKIFLLYLYRVSYFQLAKLSLLKYWRDLNIITDQDLEADCSVFIPRILFKAQANLVTQQQVWLFSKQNAYSWLRLSPDEVRDLWRMIEEGQLFQDHKQFISKIYNHYCRAFSEYFRVESVPFSLIHFISQKICASGLIQKIGHLERPKLIFDLCSAAGPFLATLADHLKSVEGDVVRVSKFLTQSYIGIEKELFPFYFSEMTLLWELSPYFYTQPFSSGALLHHHPFRLLEDDHLPGTTHNNNLTEEEILLGIEHPLGEQKKLFDFIKSCQKVDFCIVHPSSHEATHLKTYLEHIPEFKDFYESNMVSTNWYYKIGLSKLREGGKLVFLESSYWPISSHAQKLRKYILENAKISEIYDFGSALKPRYLFVLERCRDKEARDNHRIKFYKIKSSFNKVNFEKLLEASQAVQKSGDIYSDEEVETFFSPVIQRDLTENPWSCLEEFTYLPILKKIKDKKLPLGSYFSVKKSEQSEINEGDLLSLIPTDRVLVYDNRFVYRDSHFQEQPPKEAVPESDCLVISKKSSSFLSPKLLSVFLNSDLLQFWYKLQCFSSSTKKHFNQQDLLQIPLPLLSFSDHKTSLMDEKRERFSLAIQRRDINYLKAGLLLEMKHGDVSLVAEVLESLVDETEKVDKMLEKYSHFRKEDKVNWEYFKKILPLNLQVPLKEHQQTFIETECQNLQNFCFLKGRRLKHPQSQEDFIQIISLDNQFINIFGDSTYLSILEEELKSYENLYWDEIEKALYLPKDLKIFMSFQSEISQKWKELEGWKKNIKEVCDEVIFRFYGFEPENENKFSAKESANFISIIQEALK